MTKNPFANAILANLYITFVSSVMFYGTKNFPRVNSVIIPVAILSLFSLSAAIMGYLFLYRPLQLYFGGKKKDATELFLKTVAIFAVITAVVFSLIFSRILY